MKYEAIVKAKFTDRPNRFVAKVELCDGQEVAVHVKNTGRCKELLVPGATVYLEDFDGRMGNRKMRYSLIAVEKRRAEDTLLINMDSQAPNKVVKEALLSGKLQLPGLSALTLIRPETSYGNSRFDFYVEGSGTGKTEQAVQKAFIEVKGVTLEHHGFARFPDAPTERGVKHIEELCKAAEDGYGTYIVFVIQMQKIHTFGPNYETHPQFGEALAEAKSKGVQIVAYDCLVTQERLELDQPVPIDLARSHV